MKVINFNAKNRIAKLRINSLDDLWHLSKIVEKGDLASAKTTRKVKHGGETERQKAVKKSVYIKIEVEKVELAHELKLRGRVVEGPEDITTGSIHTLDISPGTELKLQKPKWMKYQLDRLREAERASVAPKALICVMDDEQANFAYLTASGTKSAGRVSLRLSKKREKEKKEKKESVEKLIKAIKIKGERADHIILASPIVWKDVIFKEIKTKMPKLAKKIILENVSTGSKRGLHELMSQGTVNKIIKQSRSAKEAQLIDKLLAGIARGNKAVYGISEVQSNSVSVLLVTDNFLGAHKDEVINIINTVEASKGEVHIIDSKSEAGKKLDSLGGIGGLLRY
jgi:protein pelota